MDGLGVARGDFFRVYQRVSIYLHYLIDLALQILQQRAVAFHGKAAKHGE